MGVPDFVKYIARSSPGALCRLPKGDSTEPLLFDFILIDATNAAQTLGLEALLAFLSPNRILARSGIIFALDSQRDRSGTVRSQRHAVVRIGDLDVQVQKLCSQLSDQYREHTARHRGTARPTASPHVLTSGRGVAGEADYKLLDLQRKLMTGALAAGATALPSFLFISEDSDVLCGALCGPAAQQVSIATRLQDVLYEPSILRLDRVLAFIATCTDAFYAENEKEAKAAAAAKLRAQEERTAAARAKQAAQQIAAQKAMQQVEEEDEEEVELSVTDKAVVVETPAAPVAPVVEDRDVVRRRKQDGPMVATGVRIELSDSSSSDDDEEVEAKAPAVASKQPATSKTLAKGDEEDVAKKASASAIVTATPAPAEVVEDPTPTAGELTVSTIAYTSSVDMVFLFMLVMGNAANVPSLVRGATKVDAGSCWQAYCKHKYKILSATEAEMGRTLLSSSVTTHSTNKGSFVLNCGFLHGILDALHYADVEARPPGEEEKERALAYLSNAVYSTLRYVVGCNLERPPALQHTFLDSRMLSEVTAMLPSLSAVMWVLGQEPTRTFTFPLCGLPKKELLTVVAGGSSAQVTPAVPVASPSHQQQRDASAGSGELEVGDHLVAPVAANAWAVRGARTNTVSMTTLVHTFTSRSGVAEKRPDAAAAGVGVTLRAVPLPSMSELLKKCLQRVSPAVLAKANALVYLVKVWEYTLGMGVRRLSALTKGAANVARAEGVESIFAAVQAATVSANPMRTTAENAAAAARTKQAPGHFVYSFELRRMAPVMQSTDTATPSAVKGGSAATSAAPEASKPSAEAPNAAGTTSAAQRAVLAALGVSYDYSTVPNAPANVVHLPPSALDADDKAELQRLKKVAKKERALVASVAAAENSEDAEERDKKKAAGGAKTKAKKEKANGKKRLGKRERLQMQKTMTRPGAAAAAAASSAVSSAVNKQAGQK